MLLVRSRLEEAIGLLADLGPDLDLVVASWMSATWPPKLESWQRRKLAAVLSALDPASARQNYPDHMQEAVWLLYQSTSDEDCSELRRKIQHWWEADL
jgi:hypothetical protein